MTLLELPVLVLENILSYLTYDEVAKLRLVSKDFNEICMRLLNRGFMMIERHHSIVLKSVKVQLPRRESERRNHPLAKHNDILTSIETRISMLNMTYSKFIEKGLCCFIPGKVLDEIRRVVNLVESSESPPRPHEVLQELRDISSMAIEHFDEKISPVFRKQLQDGIMEMCPRPTQVLPMATRHEMNHIHRRTLLNAKLSLILAGQFKYYARQMLFYKKVAFKQRVTVRNMARRQRQQDNTIADLKKRIEECDIKYNELTRTKQAAGVKDIASTSCEVATVSRPHNLRHFGSQIKLDLSVLPIGKSPRIAAFAPNIKPRKPQIKLPSLCEDSSSKSDKKPVVTSTAMEKMDIHSNMVEILEIASKLCDFQGSPNNSEGESEQEKRTNIFQDEVNVEDNLLDSLNPGRVVENIRTLKRRLDTLDNIAKKLKME